MTQYHIDESHFLWCVVQHRLILFHCNEKRLHNRYNDSETLKPEQGLCRHQNSRPRHLLWLNIRLQSSVWGVVSRWLRSRDICPYSTPMDPNRNATWTAFKTLENKCSMLLVTLPCGQTFDPVRGFPLLRKRLRAPPHSQRRRPIAFPNCLCFPSQRIEAPCLDQQARREETYTRSVSHPTSVTYKCVLRPG